METSLAIACDYVEVKHRSSMYGPGPLIAIVPTVSFNSTMALVSLHVSEDLERLEIVNQLLLPHVTEFIPINTIQDAHEAIKSMKVFVLISNIPEYYHLIFLLKRFEVHQPSRLLLLFPSRD
jgi:hypothetical protein